MLAHARAPYSITAEAKLIQITTIPVTPRLSGIQHSSKVALAVKGFHRLEAIGWLAWGMGHVGCWFRGSECITDPLRTVLQLSLIEPKITDEGYLPLV